MAWADEVVWTIPRSFPHKAYEGAAFKDRIAMLCQIASSEPGFSAAVSEGGLYLEMADEARAILGPDTEIALVCGRDAAERIATWDYGRAGVFDQMLRKYTLLVAARAGEYPVPARYKDRIVALPLSGQLGEISSTEIRRRIAQNEEWRHLVPDAVAETVARIY
jgi:nicotinic acid mononucleotide adenylyltransferase